MNSPYKRCFSMRILQHAMSNPRNPGSGSCLWIDRKKKVVILSPRSQNAVLLIILFFLPGFSILVSQKAFDSDTRAHVSNATARYFFTQESTQHLSLKLEHSSSSHQLCTVNSKTDPSMHVAKADPTEQYVTSPIHSLVIH